MTITVRVGLKGGSGSGNFGHRGRPGKLGGSTPKGAGAGGLSDPRGDLRAADDVGIYDAPLPGGGYNTNTESKSAVAALERTVVNELGKNVQGTLDKFGYDHMKSKYKNNIVTELSDATGLPYEDVNKFVHQWATSSNDTDMRSLSIQKAIADEFGLELSPWQKQRMTDLKYPNQKIAIYQRQKDAIDKETASIVDKTYVNNTKISAARQAGDAAEVKRLLSENVKLNAKSEALYSQSTNLSSRILELRDIGISQTRHIFEGHADPNGDARKLVRAMYDNQQKQFKAKGITEITVFRGAGTPFSQRKSMQDGQTVVVKGNVAESWSASSYVAHGFSNSYSGGVILASRVPVERVFTSAASGLGCLNEQEFVLLGSRFSKDTAYVMKVYFSSDEKKAMETKP